MNGYVFTTIVVFGITYIFTTFLGRKPTVLTVG